MIEALKFSCEKKNVHPQIGLNIFRIWVFEFTFLGMQLAWNLKPFLGDKKREFEFFHAKEGSFYLAIFQSAANMYSIENNTTETKDIKVEVKLDLPEVQEPIDPIQNSDTLRHD